VKARDLAQRYGWHCPALRSQYGGSVICLGAASMAPSQESLICCDECINSAMFLNVADDVLILGACAEHAEDLGWTTAGAPSFNG
jgi:hypothetical protein